jgi:branched-chain amino acid transport system substrate-binding protein
MKDLNPEALYLWIPGGTQPAALGKALAERGIDPKKTKVLGQEALTDDNALRGMGDIAIGIITDYDYNLKNAKNEAFVKAYNEAYNRNPDAFSIGGWDGIHLIYEALKKTGGNADGETLINAAKGMTWDSPRGPMSIDAETRDVVQTIYFRRVEKVGGRLLNVDFNKVENVKDPIKARMN